MKPHPLFQLIIIVLGLCIATQVAGSQTIFDRTYEFDQLDKFWTTTLEQPPPDARRFAVLGSEPGGLKPMVDIPQGFLPEVSPAGIIVSEGQLGTTNAERRGFPIIAIPRDDAPILYQRLALLELYLGRYRSFKRSDSDTAERLDLLRRRQNSASAELYLITLMLYFAEPTLSAKCERIARLEAVDAGVPPAAKDADLLPPWRPLLPILTAARAGLTTDTLRGIVCAVRPVRSSGEMKKRVTDRVHGQIMKKVKTKIDETNSALSKASEKFQDLVKAMDVTIKSREILDLERDLGNVQSNLLLVKTDQLKAADTINELQGVDLTQLDKASEDDKYQQAQDKLKQMVAEIDAVLEAAAQLATVSGDPAIGKELEDCRVLATVYDALDLTRDTANLEAGVLNPYANCLTKTRMVVQRFQAPSLNKAFAAELARDVRQISDAFLASGD